MEVSMTRFIFRHSAAAVVALAVLILAGGATWAQSNDPPPKPKNDPAQMYQQILQPLTQGSSAKGGHHLGLDHTLTNKERGAGDVLIDRWQRNNIGK
jgi:hypothetical protein